MSLHATSARAGEPLVDALRRRLNGAARAARPRPQGVVSEVVGLGIRVRGLTAAVGELVTVHRSGERVGPGRLPAQVVAVHADGAT